MGGRSSSGSWEHSRRLEGPAGACERLQRTDTCAGRRKRGCDLEVGERCVMVMLLDDSEEYKLEAKDLSIIYALTV